MSETPTLLLGFVAGVTILFGVPGANYVQGGLFKAFVVRDGRLITGQQQYSGRKVAQALIEALGI
jgi:putative intracellular protease/amidase